MEEIKFIDRKTKSIIHEKPPGEHFLKFLYHHPLGKLPLELLVKRKMLSSIYGSLMDKPNSAQKIRPFVEEYQINMDEAQKNISEFHSFNDFFYRKLKPEARPIEDGFISPADGKLIAFEDVSEINNFFVKGNEFTLPSFLRNKQLAEKYQSGSLILVRLAPNDYHRFHFPFAGNASEVTKISGAYYSVSPFALIPNFAKVFCENKREYTILSTADKGDILISPVGATMVGSIIETFNPANPINKGDEMGYFAFGGSSILMLIEKGMIKIDDDLLENTRNNMETAVKMGEKIGE